MSPPTSASLQLLYVVEHAAEIAMYKIRRVGAEEINYSNERKSHLS